jgi:hypothetical protein
MTKNDIAIIAAWEAFKAAHTDLDQMDDDLLGTETEQENAIWNRVDAAEQIVLQTPATTPQGLQCKLMVALYHRLSQRIYSKALLAGLFEALEAKERGMDWPDRLLFSAIQSLRRMEA